MTQAVSFTWAVPKSQVTGVADSLRQAEAKLEPELQPFTPPKDEARDYIDAAFEPLLIIAGAVALGYLIDKVTTAVKDVRHGGAVVDVRQGRVDVRANPALPAKTLLVVDDTGVHQFDTEQSEEIGDVIRTGVFGSGAS
jgi:hypothetical protein